jgi:hypothetical protein
VHDSGIRRVHETDRVVPRAELGSGHDPAEVRVAAAQVSGEPAALLPQLGERHELRRRREGDRRILPGQADQGERPQPGAGRGGRLAGGLDAPPDVVEQGREGRGRRHRERTVRVGRLGLGRRRGSRRGVPGPHPLTPAGVVAPPALEQATRQAPALAAAEADRALTGGVRVVERDLGAPDPVRAAAGTPVREHEAVRRIPRITHPARPLTTPAIYRSRSVGPGATVRLRTPRRSEEPRGGTSRRSRGGRVRRAGPLRSSSGPEPGDGEGDRRGVRQQDHPEPDADRRGPLALQPAHRGER